MGQDWLGTLLFVHLAWRPVDLMVDLIPWLAGDAMCHRFTGRPLVASSVCLSSPILEHLRPRVSPLR